MKTTEQGIRYIELTEGEPAMDIPAMVKRAKTAYKPFNFKDKIELLIFYNDRKDFSHTIFTEYGIMDDEFDGKKAVHHPFGVKSIIGIELSGDETIPLIAFVIGRTIEHFKQNMDIRRHEEWRDLDKSDSYQCWQTYFCQVHSSVIRYRLEGSADLFLKSLPFVLAKKEESFSPSHIIATFRHIIHSLSELYALRQANETEQANDHMKTISELTDPSFIEIYDKLYTELAEYLETLGVKYNEVHDFSIFSTIEQRKNQLAALYGTSTQQ
ncbi:hypothetical protein NM897_15155 [Planococcus maritimus]|uniref:hypothetical protein n=1 Tax=Planococcus maritimus TaxID=192421 RepID=UPI0031388EE2